MPRGDCHPPTCICIAPWIKISRPRNTTIRGVMIAVKMPAQTLILGNTNENTAARRGSETIQAGKVTGCRISLRLIFG
jgi:hypothetical protein